MLFFSTFVYCASTVQSLRLSTHNGAMGDVNIPTVALTAKSYFDLDKIPVWDTVPSFDKSRWNSMVESCLDIASLNKKFDSLVSRYHEPVSFHNGLEMAMCFHDTMVQPHDFKPPFDMLNPDAETVRILRGKTLGFAGDSMMRKLVQNLQCYSDHVGLNLKLKFGENGNIIKPFSNWGQADLAFFNVGAHFNLQEQDGKKRYENTLRSFLKTTTPDDRKRLFWLESAVQHYAGGSYFQESLEIGDQCFEDNVNCKCAEIKNEWSEVANWRNEIASPIMESNDVPIIPIFPASYSLWYDHNGFDCTHFCMNGPFMRYQILLILGKVIERFK